MKSGNVENGVSLSLSLSRPFPPSLPPSASFNAANINDAARVVRMGGADEGEIEDLLVARSRLLPRRA